MTDEDIDRLTRCRIFVYEIDRDHFRFETATTTRSWNKATVARAILRLIKNHSFTQTKHDNLEILASALRRL